MPLRRQTWVLVIKTSTIRGLFTAGESRSSTAEKHTVYNAKLASFVMRLGVSQALVQQLQMQLEDTDDECVETVLRQYLASVMDLVGDVKDPVTILQHDIVSTRAVTNSTTLLFNDFVCEMIRLLHVGGPWKSGKCLAAWHIAWAVAYE